MKFELKTKNETEDPLFTLCLVSCLMFNSMFDVGKSASASHRTPYTQFFASGGGWRAYTDIENQVQHEN